MPDCVAAAKTQTEVCALIPGAIELYLEVLEEHGMHLRLRTYATFLTSRDNLKSEGETL